MKLQSEIQNAFKKCETLEAQLERTILQVERGDYGDVSPDTLADLYYTKDKVIDAKEALEGRIPA